MIEVVGISFKQNGKIYYFSCGDLELHKGITVIVNTDRGMQFGKVIEEKKKISLDSLKSEIKPVLRIATKKDYIKYQKNLEDGLDALKKCRHFVEERNMNMQIIDAEFTFDRKQLVFRFISDNRIDFRDLVKDLANIYKTRIELRQVGARDKAKEIGGYGMCGRTLCCSKYLEDLDSVSINMAKNQNISLNPNKINGLCGRLLCCLKYEDDTYTECKIGLPIMGSKVKTKEGTGKVVSINILKGVYRVEIPEKGIVEVKLNEND